jgi:hypothetical protein
LLPKDLAAQKPDIVQALSEEWSVWGKRVGAAEEIPGVNINGKITGAAKQQAEEPPDN